ncbi:MAG: T9SS type A sorting domain-containing protein [Saprospiraceae bacterium]|nr:T9SS type A sorting domain-containing protein [Saprospiraceae bacterium]
MKNLLFTLVFSLFTASLVLAQSFTISPDTVTVFATPDIFDVEAHNEMTNMTNNTITIRWERTILVNPGNLDVQVCDPILCYAPFVDTRTFPLVGDTTITMIIHLLNPEELDPYNAVVQMVYTDVDNPSNTKTSIYVFNIETTSTNNPQPLANVKLYPNPVTEYFSLDNAEEVGRVLVFARDGRQVATFNAATNQTYSIATLPTGAYVVALESKKGRVFQAIEVKKN